MIPVVVGFGLVAWFLLRDGTSKPDEPPSEDPDPDITPDPSTTEWTETAEWSGEYAETGYDGTERVVWVMRTGIRYQDGSTQMDSTEYVLIGNKNHTAFRSANSDRGTLDIKKEYTGGDADVKNAIVYASIAEAEAKVRELSEEPENDPTQPQPQPEDTPEDSGNDDGFGGLPARPGNALGQGYGGNYSM